MFTYSQLKHWWNLISQILPLALQKSASGPGVKIQSQRSTKARFVESTYFLCKKLDVCGDLMAASGVEEKRTRKSPEPPRARDTPLPQNFLPRHVWHCVYKKNSVPAPTPPFNPFPLSNFTTTLHNGGPSGLRRSDRYRSWYVLLPIDDPRQFY